MKKKIERHQEIPGVNVEMVMDVFGQVWMNENGKVINPHKIWRVK